MTTRTDIPSSSSSPSLTHPWTYEVFLSFRGEDTRRNFTDFLYTSLIQKGIVTFRDDEELERGKPIAPKLLKAIEESRFVIFIFSKNYANSTWCLDELVKAVECMNMMGQTILPVFYHVDPSDVRKKAHFEEAFSKHEEAFKDDTKRVQNWRDALTEVANLSGWHLQDEYESTVIQNIVGKIFIELNQTISSVSTDLVGMDSRVKEMLSCLDIGPHKVCVIGILGIGGIGKTTVARVVYERICARFEACSFLANVREVTEKLGLVDLQKQLLLDILLESNVNVHNIDQGISLIRQRLRTKMVLIILDDVDTLEQLKALCHHSWFGSGSRIIITSRDEHLLSTFGVNKMYKVKELNDSEALKLLSWKAFKKDQVGEGFLKLSKNVVEYASGLPLVLTVLGSLLFGKSDKEWSSALDRLKEYPEKRIIDVLKVSFDALQITEKKVFLDIACFFKGEDKDRVAKILESGCRYRPGIDIKVLMDKSLVTLFGRKLYMHDMIQELGWEIVRRECRENPGNRSRLWLPQDIIPVLVKNKGTDTIEGIFLNLQKQEEVHLNADSFSKMSNLRLLRICNVASPGSVEYLSNELQLLEWHACPLNSLPSNFQSDKLVELKMHSSCVKQLWNGNESWSMLKFVDLSDSEYLIRTPNFTKAPNIEMLVLQGCSRLDNVHPSLGFLKQLILLNMRNCKSVKSLPSFISLESLETLNLSACSRLEKFPEIKGNMQSLLELHLDGTAIEELPPSIELLTSLTLLNLGDCKNLFHLPSTIQHLTSLKTLILSGCSELNDIPENLNCVECLEELDISGTAIRESSFIVGLKNLKSLSFRGCKDRPSRLWHSLFNCWWWGRNGHVPVRVLLPTSFSGLSSLTSLNLSDRNLMDGEIPNDLGSVFSLKTLDLSQNNFVGLPESISQLSKLEFLNVSNCSRLQFLPKKLPLSVQHVNAADCASLIDFPNQVKIFASPVSGMTTINSLISSKFQDCYTIPKRYLNLYTSSAVSGSTNVSEQQEWRPADDLQTQLPQRELELLEYRSTPLQAVFYQTEIPEWFSHMVTECPIAIQLSPDLSEDRKWMGVALCAVFSVKGHPAVSRIETISGTSYFYQCKLRIHKFELEPVILESKIHPILGSDGFLCVFYVPCLFFPKMLNDSSVMGAVFETNNPCVDVQKCGVRLVYEQDVAGFIQTLLQCVTRRHPHQIVLSDDRNLNEVDEAAFKSGWFSIVDNILRWEKIIPAYEEGSVILLRKNIESILPRYLEALNHKCQFYHFGLSGIPAWFKPQLGSSMSIQLPKNLHKSKKWMGFALCTSLVVDRRKLRGGYDLFCGLNSKEFNIELSLSSANGDKHQLWIIYIPRAQIPKYLIRSNSSSMICTLFRTDNAGVEVQICGFRILYQQDLQGFVQTITHSILRGSNTLFGFYNKLVVEDWINLIKLPSGEVDLEPIIEYETSPEVVSNQPTEEGHEIDSTTPWERDFRLISHDLRQRDWSVAEFRCRLPGIAIPKWFLLSSEGYSEEIQLPPNLYDDSNWMGFAVCAYLSIHEHPTIILDTPDSEFTRVLICQLDTNVPWVNFRREEHTNKHMWLHACDFTWFLYIPRVLFSTALNQCNLVRVTFGSNSLGLGFRECALRVVFKEDVEELIQTLTLSRLSAKCHLCELAKHGNQNI